MIKHYLTVAWRNITRGKQQTGFIFAIPMAWYALSQWLQNFAYQTELNWWVFLVSGMSAAGIALLTVSWQSWRAARRNPVEALRYE